MENNGGYDLEGVVWHQHSNRLVEHVLKIFPKHIPVVDFGCGHNFYVSVLNYAGYEATGFDLVDLGSKYFHKYDVSQPIPLNGKYNVISLEVGEHLPAELASGYLDNVASCQGNVLMSWAIVGQAGHGHVNCRNNDWVIEQMEKRGYKMDFQITHDLRNAVRDCHCSWFRNTLMYFVPK